MEKRKELFLLQKYDNGDFYVYNWTPSLAQKGYVPLSEDDATEYLALQLEGKNNSSYLEENQNFQEIKVTNEKSGWVDPEEIDVEDLVEFEEGDDVGIINDLEQVDNEEVDEDELLKIDITQEDILAKELSYIKRCSHKSTVEKHLLEKYHVEIPVGQLNNMKVMANQMLTSLCNDGKLYLMDGEVKLP